MTQSNRRDLLSTFTTLGINGAATYHSNAQEGRKAAEAAFASRSKSFAPIGRRPYQDTDHEVGLLVPVPQPLGSAGMGQDSICGELAAL